ncbi:MAG: TIGR04372 family glycosyltransferase [Gemmataceae bacterium]
MNRLKDGVHILALLLAANLRGILCGRVHGSVRRIGQAVFAAIRLRGSPRVLRLVDLCLESGVPVERLARNTEAAYVIGSRMNAERDYAAAFELASRMIRERGESAKLLTVRGNANISLGRYSEGLADLNRVAELNPVFARDLAIHPTRSYLFGLRGELDAARKAMAEQMLPPGSMEEPAAGLARFLYEQLAPYWRDNAAKGEVAVVIGDFQVAVGHAILDPYHYIQLFRHRFDHFILVHPPYDWFTPATRVAAFIHDSHFDQIETTDIHAHRFGWKYLDELRCKNVTFLVHHYWSLNRQVFLARKDPNHPLSRGRLYFEVPPKLAHRAESVLHRAGFDFERPFVVIHTREHGYHAFGAQSYRNTDIRNYLPALRRLVELGYHVVRIGDRKMTSIRAELPEVVELPLHDDYIHAIDPFVISRCRFMISCQSGPCSYARAFGKPNLVLNAVYHYTLLPERQELLGFKNYRDRATGESLDLDRIFRIGAHLFDNTDHFVQAGIAVEDMTADEILAATEEMLDWLDHPDRPETRSQTRFRERMEWYSANPDPSHPLANAMSDYIGYSLPECRISDAVCRLRPGFLETTADKKAA